MTALYLISYDMQSDKHRKKVADKLLEYGLTRVQYSVFAGPLKDHLLQQLQVWLPLQLTGKDDRLFILPLTLQSIKRGSYWGTAAIDESYITNTQHTLYID